MIVGFGRGKSRLWSTVSFWGLIWLFLILKMYGLERRLREEIDPRIRALATCKPPSYMAPGDRLRELESEVERIRRMLDTHP